MQGQELGIASFLVESFGDSHEQEYLTTHALSNGKRRSQLVFNMHFSPILGECSHENTTKEPVPESNTGISRSTVSQAKDLGSSETLVVMLFPNGQTMLNCHAALTTRPLKRKNDPSGKCPT